MDTISVSTLGQWIVDTAKAVLARVGYDTPPAPETSQNRRTHSRFNDHQASVVTIISDTREMSLSGRTIDVNDTGMRIECNVDLPIGSALRCSLYMGKVTRVAFFQVVWSRREGTAYQLGLRCVAHGYSREYLKEYLNYLLSGGYPWADARHRNPAA